MQKKPKKLQRIWFIENDTVKMGYYIGECMTQNIFNPTTYTKKAAIAMDGTPTQTTRTFAEIFETKNEAQKELQRRNCIYRTRTRTRFQYQSVKKGIKTYGKTNYDDMRTYRQRKNIRRKALLRHMLMLYRG